MDRIAHDEPGMFKHGRILFLALLVLGPVAFAAGAKKDFSHLLDDEPEFLSVDKAFLFSAELAADGSLQAQWQMPDGYYLYRHRFGFDVPAGSAFVLGESEIPPGKTKVDEYFGEVQVYYHAVSVRVPVTRSAAGADMFEASITYQGCADRGLCYPPETKHVAFPADAIRAQGGPSQTAVAAAAAPGAAANADAAEKTEEQWLAGLLADGNLPWALALFFVAGLGLAFTPCVLPMVPILSSIIVGQGESVTRARAFSLSLAYVLGMAGTYAVLGVLVGLFGASMNLQAALQSAPVLIGFAVVFVLLALSMFGFYELQLPQAWQNGVNALSQNLRGGEHVGVAVMGSLSSLVVSPCLSAPLAAALIYISSTGDAWLGGGALLAIGLGMGVPLLVIGSSGAHLLPRAGAWMDNVKAVFGVLLLGVAIWLLERVVAPQVTLLLWAILAIAVGVYLGALDFSPRQGWGQLWKASGAFSLIYGVLLLIGAASGARDPLQPLSEFSAPTVAAGAATHLEWRKVRGVAGLESELTAAAAAGEPVVLDFYADWCISCKVMERTVFSTPTVAAGLSRFRLLQADVTANDEHDQALLKQYRLYGPPSMLFFDAQGRELTDLRMQGEMDRAAFERHLERVSSAT
jgi:thioredoxin:protein disulfide reductase